MTAGYVIVVILAGITVAALVALALEIASYRQRNE